MNLMRETTEEKGASLGFDRDLEIPAAESSWLRRQREFGLRRRPRSPATAAALASGHGRRESRQENEAAGGARGEKNPTISGSKALVWACQPTEENRTGNWAAS
jgi:hypothetical protein